MSVDFSNYSVELFIEANNTLGEGPIWWKSRNLLAWVDILECKIFAATWDGEIVEIITMPEPVGCIFEMPDGSLLAGCQSGLRTVPAGELVARVPDAAPDMRINDGKIDPWGNLVFGTMGFPEAKIGSGSLWSWNGTFFSCLLSDLTIPNGMVWTSNKDLLFVDSTRNYVSRYSYHEPTKLEEVSRLYLDLEPGSVLDGMTWFEETVIGAVWGSGALLAFKASTTSLLSLEIVKYPTSVLAHPSGGKVIVTSASTAATLAPSGPYAGSVLLVNFW